MRYQLAVAPDVRDGTTLVHPETGACATVPPAFVDLLPFAARPFTARELVERSGAPLSPTAVEHALLELRAAGLVVPAAGLSERVSRAAFNPLALLSLPPVGLFAFLVAALGVALQIQSAAFFATAALRGLRGVIVVPLLLAIVLVPAARAMFRAALLGGGSVRPRLRGVIPTWEVEHPPPTTRPRRLLAHVSGFLFDFLVINACLLTMKSKPFELGYAGLETPIAFLAMAATSAIIAANPLAKYDVYYALEDALGVADLRGHARARFFQLVTRRRATPSTIAYALYFVLSVAYGLFISFGLLAIAYGVASRLFPADTELRIGLATILVGTVGWRAVRAIHAPLVRALASRRRARGGGDAERSITIALPDPVVTLAPSLHPSEGFPFATSFAESVDERVNDFAALGDSVGVHVLSADAVVAEARHLALDDAAVRALSLRMFALPPRALGDEQRTILAVAHALGEKLPLDRYEPVPLLGVVDGTFKHGALDVAARLRSASELDVYRALFAPLRSRHVVERDRVDLAFRDRAVDRFTRFVLVDENDDAGRALRIAGLRRVIERAPASARPPADGAATVLAWMRARPEHNASLALAARIRRTGRDFLDEAGCVALFAPLDAAALATLPPPARAWAFAAGLVFEETRSRKTSLASHVRAPTLVIPTGPRGAPTGLKLRVLSPEPFDPARRVVAPTARYEFISPERNFLGAAALSADVAALPVYLGDGAVPGRVDAVRDTVFAFDGELKAMACRHLLELRALSTGGFNHPFAAALARHLAKEKSVTFVVDDEAPVYRRARTDQLLDPLVRTLQLAARVKSSSPSTRLFLMRGLRDGTKKLDLDEVAGLSGSARDDALRTFRGNTGDAVDAAAMLASPAVGPYLDELNAFGDRYYAALDDIRRARVAGRSAEARNLAAVLPQLADARKRLAHLATGARDAITAAFVRRR